MTAHTPDNQTDAHKDKAFERPADAEAGWRDRHTTSLRDGHRPHIAPAANSQIRHNSLSTLRFPLPAGAPVWVFLDCSLCTRRC